MASLLLLLGAKDQIYHANDITEANTQEELEEVVEETIEHATEWGVRPNGGKYWYDEVTGRLVVKEPNGQGTVYNPEITGGPND